MTPAMHGGVTASKYPGSVEPAASISQPSGPCRRRSTAKDQVVRMSRSSPRHSDGMSGMGSHSRPASSSGRLPTASVGVHGTGACRGEAKARNCRKSALWAANAGAPWSKRVVRHWPRGSSHCTVFVASRPPAPRDLSTTCTAQPDTLRARAQVAPAMPAPTTATFRGETSRVMAQAYSDPLHGRVFSSMAPCRCLIIGVKDNSYGVSD